MIVTAEVDRVTVLAPAKVNLFLEVGGRRPDGFHEIDTVFQAVSLYDGLVCVPAARLDLEVSGRWDVPRGETNLVMQAARALSRRAGLERGARLVLEKRIPVGAGLGGGSSDAAAALVALNRLWECDLSDDDLLALAGGLGSDVAFFIRGATARGRGRGERLDRIVTGLVLWYVLVWPGAGMPTAEAYRCLDDGPRRGPRSPDELIHALEAGDARGVADAAFNRFEEVVTVLRPCVSRALDRLRAAGALTARMTGSGSAVYGLFDRRSQADRAASQLRDVSGDLVWVAGTEMPSP